MQLGKSFPIEGENSALCQVQGATVNAESSDLPHEQPFSDTLPRMVPCATPGCRCQKAGDLWGRQR